MNKRLFEKLIACIKEHEEIAHSERSPSRSSKVDAEIHALTQLGQASLPTLRFAITESAKILRCSRAHLYKLLRCGAIRAHKDGRRRYISIEELRRYVAACDVAA